MTNNYYWSDIRMHPDKFVVRETHLMFEVAPVVKGKDPVYDGVAVWHGEERDRAQSYLRNKAQKDLLPPPEPKQKSTS